MVKLAKNSKMNKPKRAPVLGGRAKVRAPPMRAAPSGVRPPLPKPVSHAHYVQAMIDPVAANPAKVPDEHVSPTVAIKLVDEYTVASDVNGVCMFGVHPSLTNSRQSWTITAGTSGAAAQAAHPDAATTGQQFRYGRQAVYEIEINYIGAVQTSAGRLIAVEATTEVTFDNVVINNLADDGESGPAQAGRRVVVRPTQSPRFEDFAVLGGAWMVPTFAYWGFVGLGLPPSTTLFSVRVTRHFEGIPNKSSLLRGVASPEPYNQGTMAIAANMSQVGKHGHNLPGGKLAMIKQATKAAEVAWAALGPQVQATAAKYGAHAASWAGESLLALMV